MTFAQRAFESEELVILRETLRTLKFQIANIETPEHITKVSKDMHNGFQLGVAAASFLVSQATKGIAE